MMEMEIFKTDLSTAKLPFFSACIQAGFPSPADDYLESLLSLDDICLTNRETTFLGRVAGKSLQDIHVYEGDIVVIDKSLMPQNGDLVVAVINSEFTAKFISINGKEVFLYPANKNFKPIRIAEFDDFKIWGVVTRIIQDVKGRWNVGHC
jgi:DNA polymerase V